MRTSFIAAVATAFLAAMTCPTATAISLQGGEKGNLAKLMAKDKAGLKEAKDMTTEEKEKWTRDNEAEKDWNAGAEERERKAALDARLKAQRDAFNKDRAGIV